MHVNLRPAWIVVVCGVSVLLASCDWWQGGIVPPTTTTTTTTSTTIPVTLAHTMAYMPQTISTNNGATWFNVPGIMGYWGDRFIGNMMDVPDSVTLNDLPCAYDGGWWSPRVQLQGAGTYIFRKGRTADRYAIRDLGVAQRGINPETP